MFIFGCTGSLLLCVGFSLVAVSTGSSLVGMCGLLIAVASLVGRTGSGALGLQELWLPGSRAQAQYLWRVGLHASRHGSFRTRDGSHVPCMGRWGFLSTAPPGKPGILQAL